MRTFLILIIVCCALSCSNESKPEESKVPVIAFLDAFQDETIEQAKKGFFDSLLVKV
ncbi:MAG: hypothetical protein H0V65_02180 [Chitinophagales bacterium]|jgi:hypothetical protein|nr:hypothetical protein [Chitinophagales bacterium]